MARSPLVRPAAPVLVACVIAVAALWALPARAEDQTVRLLDNRFDPSQVSVVAGDTITWSWDGENRHSVQVDRFGDDGPPAYDSHPACSSDTPRRCGSPGLQTTWTPTEPGNYRLQCRLHGFLMGGSLTVSAPEGGSASPSPTPDATASPSSTPEDDASPSPTRSETTPKPPEQDEDDPGSTGDPEPSDSPRPQPTRGTADDPGIRYGPPGPIDAEPPPTILPSVAPSQPDGASQPDPDLEQFPTAPDSGSQAPDAGQVAIESPGGPSPRAVWVGIGSASVLAAAGAFVKVVLFGAPWS